MGGGNRYQQEGCSDNTHFSNHHNHNRSEKALVRIRFDLSAPGVRIAHEFKLQTHTPNILNPIADDPYYSTLRIHTGVLEYWCTSTGTDQTTGKRLFIS